MLSKSGHLHRRASVVAADIRSIIIVPDISLSDEKRLLTKTWRWLPTLIGSLTYTVQLIQFQYSLEGSKDSIWSDLLENGALLADRITRNAEKFNVSHSQRLEAD